MVEVGRDERNGKASRERERLGGGETFGVGRWMTGNGKVRRQKQDRGRKETDTQEMSDQDG